MGTHVSWTKRERELVNALIQAIKDGYKNPVRRAANDVRIRYSTAKNTLYRIRNRYDLMRNAIDEYGSWRKKMRGRRFL